MVKYLVEGEKRVGLPIEIYDSFDDYLSILEFEVKSSVLGSSSFSKKVSGKEVEERLGFDRDIDKEAFGALVELRGIMLSLLSYVVSSVRGGGVVGDSFPLLMGSASVGKTYILTDVRSPLVRLLKAAGVYVKTIVPRSEEIVEDKLPSQDTFKDLGKELYKVVGVIPGYFEGVLEESIVRGDVVVVVDELLNARADFIDELIRWSTDPRGYRVSLVASSNDPITRENVADILQNESFRTLLSRMMLVNFDYVGNHPAYMAMKGKTYDPDALVYILFPEETFKKLGLEVEKDSGSLVFSRYKFLQENKAGVERFLKECVRVARKLMILKFIEEVSRDEDLLDEVRSNKKLLLAEYYYLREVIEKLIEGKWEKLEEYKKDEKILKVIEEGGSVNELVEKLSILLDDVLVKREDLRERIAFERNGILKTVCDTAVIEFRRKYPDFDSYLSNVVRGEWVSYLKAVYNKEKIIADRPTPGYRNMGAILLNVKDDLDERDNVREYLMKHPEGMAYLFKDKFSDTRLINAYMKALGVMFYLSGDYYMDSPEVKAGVEFLTRTTFGPLGEEILNAVQNYITAKRLDISQRSLEELKEEFASSPSLIACVAETLRERATFNKKGFIDIALRYVEDVMKKLEVSDVEEIHDRIAEEVRRALKGIPQNEKVEDVERFIESVRTRLKADEEFMKKLSDLEEMVQKTSAYRSLNSLAEDLIKVACAERLVALEGGKIEKSYEGWEFLDKGVVERKVKKEEAFKPIVNEKHFEKAVKGAYDSYKDCFLRYSYESAIDSALEVAIAAVIADNEDLRKRFKVQDSKKVGAAFLRAAMQGHRYKIDSSFEGKALDVGSVSPVVAALLGGEKFDMFKDVRRGVFSDNEKMQAASPLVAVMSCYVPFKKLNSSRYETDIKRLENKDEVLKFYEKKVEELKKMEGELLDGGEKVRSKKIRFFMGRQIEGGEKIIMKEL